MNELNGNGHKKAIHFHNPPQRVVSLVPSLTESMFELGLGEYVVGITDYCIFPQDKVQNLPRVGGPKDSRLKDILALEPDLVLANQEENSKQVVLVLEAAGIPVWVTFPKTVRQSQETLWALLEIFGHRMGMASLQTLEVTLDWMISATQGKEPPKYFCPIWHGKTGAGVDWWMTFNSHTYSHDLLRLLGYENVFGERERRYPLEADLGLAADQPDAPGDTRYPRVTLSEIQAAGPELILLPDEPFNFTEEHQALYYQLMEDTPAAKNKRIILLDGTLITWHGTRLAHALRELPALLDLG